VSGRRSYCGNDNSPRHLPGTVMFPVEPRAKQIRSDLRCGGADPRHRRADEAGHWISCPCCGPGDLNWARIPWPCAVRCASVI